MFDRILLAVDGSEPSRRATDLARDMGARLNAEVLVLHVHEHETTARGGLELETPGEAIELVDETVRNLKDAGVSARGEVVRSIYGRAARAILEVADKEGAAMVVMGSRGLSDLAGLVLGSVAHKVIHLAHVPVLVVR